MRVDRLVLRDFRNLADVELQLSDDITVLVGDNGQGKTNLLEAVYLLANLKSFRGSRRKEMIRWNCECASVKADVVSGGIRRHFEVELDRTHRRARIDGKDPRSLLGYFRGIRAIAFTPEDPSMVRGGPSGRRAFMDRGIFLIRPDHLDLVRQYSRLLEQKSAALRTLTPAEGGDQVSVWNAQLASVGARIVERRARFVAELEPLLQDVHARFVDEGPGIGAKYRNCCEPGDAQDLLEQIEARSDQEWERRQCLVGPHREELVLYLGDRALRTFGSQGQIRTAALTLKLALLQRVSAGSDDPPLFLLDDLGSELDPSRNRRLLRMLRDAGGQLLVATTSLRHVPLEVDQYRALNVVDGELHVHEDTR